MTREVELDPHGNIPDVCETSVCIVHPMASGRPARRCPRGRAPNGTFRFRFPFHLPKRLGAARTFLQHNTGTPMAQRSAPRQAASHNVANPVASGTIV
eukprot:1483310-Prymnesium_polylepis.1